ncbi:2-oxo-4-hydroxy-4-carboxy-5-ureidoimidazoline decarboxylase [Ramlibacter sp. RBP-2]|uniref:2-oxo-4-hydroxy-4-carboxy-5-ureidoimidazoline decarboxylase n=1 Tax=Ramlibacter lithotrophicus TaxID=2606681 RepID=A0A7X6DJK2_9BURK|nr:2-oxo-4-hydroxy-4-carboxy-5-ureidoimidazoline decarboxylase [Ramlibacter lithotrophicus]NKE68299.1 2-oxo-4-hydroxy-4-carboxy-5-ureidoimidazoline decarboxylase [Ramlibacter lithotrophicus]
MPLTLQQLNAAGGDEAVRLLDGIYEHSPWIAEAALAHRPFRSLAHLKCVMAHVVKEAGADEQLALVRAHPELAGKALVARALTPESTGEQHQAGLATCTPDEYARLQQLNADYTAKFGFPFILAVRGPRGAGLSRREIIATFERRLDNPSDVELAEALRNVHRIAELRLNDRFGVDPVLGNMVWDQLEQLAQHSDPGFKEQGQLTVTYLTDAHRQVAARITQHMRESGFDEVGMDAVGNVVGVYHGSGDGERRRVLTGSHYDTVRNGGKYDGRLGIFTPMACVRELSRQGRRLPFDIEVVAFAEEEGQRYHATFLGSGALIGSFDAAWLDQKDADGITMREAMRNAGLPATLDAIAALRRDPKRYLGFLEVHIEQGPVLTERDLPLGVVTSINGGVRLRCEIVGMASHAGTTPMDRRRDAAAAFAELALYVERRARQDGDSVGTIGMLEVPGGSINVVPGRCVFTLDLRAPNDAQRDAMVRDVLAELAAICERRGVRHTLEQTMQVAAAPSAPAWQVHWEQAVADLGVPVFRMPSGAGHDAMKLHQVMPQAMLFVRGQNLGISHNPLETTTSDDIQLGIEAYLRLLEQLAAKATA